jgi:hypothetical protein
LGGSGKKGEKIRKICLNFLGDTPKDIMMGSIGRETFGFEGYTLDLTRGSVRKGDREIGLRPKSFAH